MLLVFLPLFQYLWLHALAGYVLVFSLNDILFLGVQKVCVIVRFLIAGFGCGCVTVFR